MVLTKNLIQKIPQYTRNSRHFRSFVQHGTPLKFMNFIRIEIERKLRRIKPLGYPYLLIVDPCNYCNLRCPLCPTGRNELSRPQTMLSLDEFKIIMDKFSKYLFEVYLHNWGESLLNKDIYKMIAYAQSRNVGTNLSSNFVTPKNSDIENIIDSGLEYLIVSLDATTPEVYKQYRVQGDFHRVIENLNGLLRKRREKKSRTPLVEWQFIVMSINQHQLDEAKTMSKKIGVDVMRFIPVGLPFDAIQKKDLSEKWFPINIKALNYSPNYEYLQFGQKKRPGPCYYLYRSMVVNPDGGISPCCVVYNRSYDFGNIWDDPVEGIWNNDLYCSSRSLFSRRDVLNMRHTVCERCNLFRKYKNKKDNLES